MYIYKYVQENYLYLNYIPYLNRNIWRDINMTSRKEIEKILKKNKSYLKKKYHVEKIGIFGSYARGQEYNDSDVDILVTFSDSIGWEFIDLQEYLQEILGLTVDLVTIKALKPQLRDSILNEVVYA
jgi:uncharacterized protein